MSTSPSVSQDFDYDALQAALSAPVSDEELFSTIVNAPFAPPVPAALIFLGIMVFLQVDKAAGTINRIALSETELARLTTEVSPLPFHSIKIPLDHYENVIAHAIKAEEPTDTTDWKFLFDPAIEPELARINQANAGIAYSAVYPLHSRDGGALIFSYFQYQHEIGIKQMDFMSKYTQIVDEVLDKS